MKCPILFSRCVILRRRDLVRLDANELLDETNLETLFAFDQVSIPFTQNLRLEMKNPSRHPDNPVSLVGRSAVPTRWECSSTAPSFAKANKYRMWYVAFDDDTENKVAASRWRAAYAESLDGVHWIKPDLGLVEFRGNKHNNLIRTEPSPWGFVNLKVLHEPNSPDPDQRYKIATHVLLSPPYAAWNAGTVCQSRRVDLEASLRVPSRSKQEPNIDIRDLYLPNIHFEPCGGLYKWNGHYFVCGQNALGSWQPHQGELFECFARRISLIGSRQTASASSGPINTSTWTGTQP